MKFTALLFAFIPALVIGQNELSLNNANPMESQTNQVKNEDVQLSNTANAPVGGNLINQQVQINTNIDNNNGNVNFQNNIQQSNDGNGLQIQVGSRSRNTSSPSVSYSSSGSGKKKHSFVKDISKSIKAYQYKHSGKKKYRHHSGKHRRGSILKCFN
ncbi:hypothetical protein SDC9_117469 [bioreactor metagenome]|uniref:Uncharacterized protein n=1 Tax=bioreactor metagenome TaxID=1076179 RepID=A0A645C8C6_9ZZZZ